jgi:catechol 1,2-dioxygenase
LIQPRTTSVRALLLNRLFIALLGSIATIAVQADDGLRPTTTQTSIGLFYLPGAPEVVSLWREGDSGERLFLRGRVLTREGQPITDALVELWHADAQGGVDESRYRTAQRTKPDGTFHIKTVLPGHIEMARNNAIFAPKHIHVVVSHPNYQRLVSLIFFKGDERLVDTPYRELAINLEQAHADEGKLLFGLVELVLANNADH